MRRRKRQQSEHENPHEQRLREVVDMFVHDDNEKAAYLAFARELTAVQRRPYTVHRDRSNLRAGRRLGTRSEIPGRISVMSPPRAKTGDSPTERSARGTVPVFAVMSPPPDFSRRTKRVRRQVVCARTARQHHVAHR